MSNPPRGKQPLPRKKQPNADGTVSQVRYSPGVAREICERLAQGEIWFRICNTGRMPSYGTLYQWLRTYPDFAEAYAQAKAMAADLRADKALMVAEASTPATVQSDRLHVSTLQWHAAKTAPGKYGSRADEADDDGRRLVIEVRQFERVVGPDGAAYVREILPPPSTDTTDAER